MICEIEVIMYLNSVRIYPHCVKKWPDSVENENVDQFWSEIRSFSCIFSSKLHDLTPLQESQ